MNAAEENNQLAFETLLGLTEDSKVLQLNVHGLGLYVLSTKDLSDTSRKVLRNAMDYCTGTFAFEVTELVLNNSYGYQIKVPRLIQE
jgi:hypothetical protein